MSTLTLVLVVLLGFGGRWARRVGAVRWIRGRLAAPKLASTDGLHVRERVEVIQDLLGAQMRRRQRMTGRARPETVSVGARGEVCRRRSRAPASESVRVRGKEAIIARASPETVSVGARGKGALNYREAGSERAFGAWAITNRDANP